jgi:hypothetical protein
LASVHKIFEAKIQDVTNVKDVFDAKITLVEHISTTATSIKKIEDKLMETYKNQEKDLRLLTYKILVETFNSKYTNLNDDQKGLLREFINNVNNTSKFGEYYDSQLKKVVIELHKLHSEVNDKITKIKLKETINVLKTQKIGKKITDEQVSALMISYELIKEITNVRKKY